MTSMYRNPNDWVQTGPATAATPTTTGPGPGKLGATTTTYSGGSPGGYFNDPNNPTMWEGGTPNFYGTKQPTMSWGGEAGGFTMDDMYRLPSAQTGMPTTRATAQSTASSPSATNEQIQEYLRRQGVDPSLFGTVQANQLQYAKWGDPSNGMGDYAQREFMPTSREDYLAGIKDPTKSGEYRLSDGQFSTAHANYGLMVNPDGSFTRRVKVGDKDSVEVPYTQQADGSWVPDWQKAQAGSWDTNRGLKSDLRGMATVLGAAAGGYLANSAGVFDGITNAMNGAFPGVAGAAEGASAATPGLVELGGGGAGYTGSVAATGGATSLSALPGAAGSTLGGGSITELLTKYGPKVLGALTQTGGGGGGQPGQGGGGMGILDLLGAYYSSKQMKDMSGNLKGIYSDLTNRQDQFRNQLLKSYEDPNQFYGSNQWKGLESVYQNSIDRGAAKGGTLANPTDRERLLQSYAMKELENYREGLRQSAGMTKPESALGPLAEGYKAEAYANTAPFAAAARGGSGTNVMQSVNDTWKTIQDVGSTAGDVWKFISSWFD